jgi:hypothetical protein
MEIGIKREREREREIEGFSSSDAFLSSPLISPLP